MTEKSQLAFLLRQQLAGDRFAFQKIGLILGERNSIEAAMRVGVIAQIQPGIGPHPQQIDLRFVTLFFA